MDWSEWIALGALLISIVAILYARESAKAATRSADASERSADAAEQGNSLSTEQIKLHREEQNREDARYRATLSANLEVRFLVAHEGSKSFTFLVENKGPQEAKQIAVVCSDGNQRETLIPGADLLSGQQLTPTCNLGWLYGAGKFTVSGDTGRRLPFPLDPREGRLSVRYSDGNGSHVLEKRVLWSGAPSFTKREITLEDFPDALEP